MKTRTNNAFIQSFAVDAVNQLTNVTRTGTFTVSGNTSGTATNVTVNTSNAVLYADTLFASAGHNLVDGANTFTAIAKNAGGSSDTNVITAWLPAANSFTFDGNGNLTWDGQKAFEYDDENQLVRVTQTSVFKSEFVYDGCGRMRVRTEYGWVSGAWSLQSETRFIYDGMLVIQERDANNTPLVSYTRGRDLSGSFESAGGIGGLLARSDHVTTNSLLATALYHTDGNGNVTALLSTDGLVLAWYQYAPFGATLAQGGPLAEANVYRFSSKMWHERSGLYYYGFRFYSPSLQRWLNRDPLANGMRHGSSALLSLPLRRLPWEALEGPNNYAYAKNRPPGVVDVNGLWTIGIVVNVSVDFFFHLGFHVGVHVGRDPANGRWSGGVLAGPELGAGGPASAGVIVGPMVTEAPRVNCLKGLGGFVGGSAGEGTIFGGDVTASINNDGNVYFGGMAGPGAGVEAPFPASGHAGFSFDFGWDSDRGLGL